jgi:hypothetical protein
VKELPYLLPVIGFILILYGGYLLKKESKEQGTEFKELLDKQNRDSEEYNKPAAKNQDIKNRLDSVESKLGRILDILESMCRHQPGCPGYVSTVDKAEKVNNEELSAEDTDTSRNMGKGEVKYIQNLLRK